MDVHVCVVSAQGSIQPRTGSLTLSLSHSDVFQAGSGEESAWGEVLQVRFARNCWKGQQWGTWALGMRHE
jgi:hypothetical protein